MTYRLLPCTKAKAEGLSRIAGACRFVWNEILDQQEQLHASARMFGAKTPSPSFFTLGKAFTDLRRVTPWLQEFPYGVVRYTLKRQADAWSAYFKGQRDHPRFHGRHGDDSFTIPEAVCIRDGRLRIPKLGWVVIRRRGGNPYPDGEVVQVDVIRRCGKWYASVVYKVDLPEHDDNGLAIGVDMNVRQIAS